MSIFYIQLLIFISIKMRLLAKFHKIKDDSLKNAKKYTSSICLIISYINEAV